VIGDFVENARLWAIGFVIYLISSAAVGALVALIAWPLWNWAVVDFVATLLWSSPKEVSYGEAWAIWMFVAVVRFAWFGLRKTLDAVVS